MRALLLSGGLALLAQCLQLSQTKHWFDAFPDGLLLFMWVASIAPIARPCAYGPTSRRQEIISYGLSTTWHAWAANHQPRQELQSHTPTYFRSHQCRSKAWCHPPKTRILEGQLTHQTLTVHDLFVRDEMDDGSKQSCSTLRANSAVTGQDVIPAICIVEPPEVSSRTGKVKIVKFYLPFWPDTGSIASALGPPYLIRCDYRINREDVYLSRNSVNRPAG